MTVSYQRKVAEADVLKFLQMLFRWRGSIWKGVHLELFVYLFFYCLLMVVFNVFMVFNRTGEAFEVLVRYCREMIPTMFKMVTFVLLFNAVQIYYRWWAVYTMLPWPDTLCFEIGAYFRDKKNSDEKEELQLKKTIVRYLSLSYVLVFRDISERIKSRFPTLGHLEGTLLTRAEQRELERTDKERAYWLPIEWIGFIFKNAYLDGQIEDIHYSKLSLLDYRERLHNILQFDTINLPLLYTQTVHLLVYIFFVLRLFSAQKIEKAPFLIWDSFMFCALPAQVSIEFLIIVGWLKAGEIMINPFGNDDDDFDMHLLVERNFLVSYSTIEHFPGRAPKKEDLRAPARLPIPTAASIVEDALRPSNIYQGSAVPEKQLHSPVLTHDAKNPTIHSTDNPAVAVQRVSIVKTALSQHPEDVKKSPKNVFMKTTTNNRHRSRNESTNQEWIRGHASQLTTPITSRMSARAVSKKREDLVRKLVEELVVHKKVEKKRDRLEEDRTQWEDDEAQSSSRKGRITPLPSREELEELNRTQISDMDSTQKTQTISNRIRSTIKKEKQNKFHSLVKTLKISSNEQARNHNNSVQ